MAIVLSTLQKPLQTSQGYTYQDMRLDMSFNSSRNNQLTKTQEVKDVQVDYDYAAIRNSIYNLFTTVPGQKLLNPVFGINLIQFISEPVTTAIAQQIGNTIVQNITKFEPRVKVINVNVLGDPVNNQYNISLTISVPQIGKNQFKLAGTLNNSGYFVTTS